VRYLSIYLDTGSGYIVRYDRTRAKLFDLEFLINAIRLCKFCSPLPMHAAFSVTMLDVFRLAFLFAGITRLIAPWHAFWILSIKPTNLDRHLSRTPPRYKYRHKKFNNFCNPKSDNACQSKSDTFIRVARMLKNRHNG
jgi:hypothetical protein